MQFKDGPAKLATEIRDIKAMLVNTFEEQSGFKLNLSDFEVLIPKERQ